MTHDGLKMWLNQTCGAAASGSAAPSSPTLASAQPSEKSVGCVGAVRLDGIQTPPTRPPACILRQNPRLHLGDEMLQFMNFAFWNEDPQTYVLLGVLKVPWGLRTISYEDFPFAENNQTGRRSMDLQ